MWPAGLSAIAVGFMSVVVGVGVDTGVHVYAALLEARRESREQAQRLDAALDPSERGEVTIDRRIGEAEYVRNLVVRSHPLEDYDSLQAQNTEENTDD